MPRFIHLERPILVSTNLKVLYSSLGHQKNLALVGEGEFIRNRLLGRRQHVLFARNPYDRLVSAYSDKFQTHPRLLGQEGFRNWQRIQLRFLQQIGFDTNTSDERIQEALLNVEFDQFVRALPRFQYRDAHVVPQHHRRRANVKWIIPVLPGRVDKLIRIEEMDTEQINEELGLDLSTVRRNKTKHGPADEYFTPELRRIVNQVYRRDFQHLGYPQVN